MSATDRAELALEVIVNGQARTLPPSAPWLT